MAKDFAVNDLVWAKMKGFPPWPARISEAPEGSLAKSKKPQHFVYFFGTHDNAWILDEMIFPHSEEMLLNSNNYKKKSTTLQKGIDEIKEESLKAPPKKPEVKPKKPEVKQKKPSSEKSKKENPRNTSSEFESTPSVFKTSKKDTPCSISPEIESPPTVFKTSKKDTPSNIIPQPESTPSTTKTPKKVLPKKKIEKKRPKKRPAPHDDQSFNTYKDIDYSDLMANVPPNNTVAPPNIAVIPPYASHDNRQSSFDVSDSLSTTFNLPKPLRPLPPNRKKLGFIGLGVMGSLMVRQLLQTKHNVTVWNRTFKKCAEFVKLGARTAESPADLVRACDIIFCCVSDPEAVKAVFFLKDGAMEGFSGGGSSKDIGNKGYVEMTSIDPTTSQEISEAICGEGGRYLQAPMIGSRQQLKEGKILIIGSGNRSLFTECDTCFNVWASNAYYFNSDASSASKMNLLVSMVLGTTYAAVAESLALVNRCNIEPLHFLDSIENGPLNCPLIMSKGHAMLKPNAKVELPVKHLQKDLDMAVSLSNNYDQPLVLTVAVNETFKRAKREFSEKDVSAVHKCYL